MMNRCKSNTRAGTRCKILVGLDQTYCEFHQKHPMPFDEITLIESESNELQPGETRRERAKQSRWRATKNYRRWFGGDD